MSSLSSQISTHTWIAFVVLGLVLLAAKMLMTMMHKLEDGPARANSQDEKNATTGEPGTDAVEHNECAPVRVVDVRPTLTVVETQVQRQAHITSMETTQVKWQASVARVMKNHGDLLRFDTLEQRDVFVAPAKQRFFAHATRPPRVSLGALKDYIDASAADVRSPHEPSPML